jgi:hypothetical protein
MWRSGLWLSDARAQDGEWRGAILRQVSGAVILPFLYCCRSHCRRSTRESIRGDVQGGNGRLLLETVPPSMPDSKYEYARGPTKADVLLMQIKAELSLIVNFCDRRPLGN